MKQIPKAAIYCRLSEEDRNKQYMLDDSNSIQNQKALLTQYANSQDWQVYNIYSDDDYTGSDRNRPAFQQLLLDAENHRFDIVLCKTQSRFTRELELVETYIHGLFPLWGIRFVSIVDNADTANKGNKKSRQINGLVNEWFLEDMSENIRSVLTNRRQNGFHIGSFALYGYQKDPKNKGRLVIDEDAAAIVKEVFLLYAQGYGKTAIARILNARGIPNPTEYKRRKGLRYQQPKQINSTLWRYSAISSMLNNEMYIGNMVQGKYGSVSYKTKQNRPRPTEQWYRVEGTHPPIIEHSLWEQVQELLRERSRPFRNGTVGLFSGKARCACCGYVLRSTKSHGKHYLTCATRYALKEACVGAFISVELLEQMVREALIQLTSQHLDWNALAAKVSFSDDTDRLKQQLSDEIASLEKQVSYCTKGIRDAYADKVRGIITEEQYLDFSHFFSRQMNHAKQLQAQNRYQVSQLERTDEGSTDPTSRFQTYTSPSYLTHDIVNLFIERIDVGKRTPGIGGIPISIHWNF